MPLDGNQLFRKLLPLGIIIRPGAVFGLPDFIRLSVGTREQNLRCLAALDQVLSGD
jgi:histidinol-phosphate aminotransferase